MYAIKKTQNGNTKDIHKGLNSYETAYEILYCIGKAHRKERCKTALSGWQLNVNNNEIVYQITC